MRILYLLLPLGLAACDTGTPDYWHLAPTRIAANDMLYDVRVNDVMAEALRQNMMAWPEFSEVATGAAQAISQVSGCTVLELRGDPSIIEARLECAGVRAPRFTSKRRVRLCNVRYEPVGDRDVGRAVALCQ